MKLFRQLFTLAEKNPIFRDERKKRAKRIWVYLIFMCMLSAVAAINAFAVQSSDAGKAKGQLVVNCKSTPLPYAYAKAEPGFFDKTKEDILVILSNIELSNEAVMDWAERSKLESSGELRCVELTIDAQQSLISVKIRHSDFKASPSGMSTDQIFEPKTVSEKMIEGKVYCKKRQEFFGTTYQYSATFKAEIRRKEKEKRPTEADKKVAVASAQAIVYRAYENAIRSGNTEALKALVTDDLATALSGPEAKEAMEFLKLMIPSDTEFLKIAVKEKTAVLKISGKQDSEKVNGTVDMVLDDGQWKVQKLSIVNTE